MILCRCDRELAASVLPVDLEGSLATIPIDAIRSYVVARDSKDSDSTHPVGYSTCNAGESLSREEGRSAAGSSRAMSR